MQIRVVLLLIVAVLLAGCGVDDPEGLEGFETSTITVGGRELAVAVAETPTQRSQGLMGVTDLGGLDGMLFVFQVDSDGGFWMKNTLIPLDMLFIAPDGTISHYLFGVEYSPKDLRLALVASGEGEVGSAVDQVLLYCFQYDPETGRYSR